jgi:hypothetical protein
MDADKVLVEWQTSPHIFVIDTMDEADSPPLPEFFLHTIDPESKLGTLQGGLPPALKPVSASRLL